MTDSESNAKVVSCPRTSQTPDELSSSDHPFHTTGVASEGESDCLYRVTCVNMTCLVDWSTSRLEYQLELQFQAMHMGLGCKPFL